MNSVSREITEARSNLESLASWATGQPNTRSVVWKNLTRGNDPHAAQATSTGRSTIKADKGVTFLETSSPLRLVDTGVSAFAFRRDVRQYRFRISGRVGNVFLRIKCGSKRERHECEHDDFGRKSQKNVIL